MYAVIGVSGNTGAAAARTLLDRGEAVRAVVRRREAAGAFESRGAAVAVADLFDADALARALDGVTGAYVMTPPLMDVDNVREVRRAMNHAIRQAAERAGSPRVVLLSSVAAHLPSGTGPIASLHELETLFADYPGPVTVLRPPFFLENWASSLGPAVTEGVFPSMMAPGVAIDMASTADIGRTAAELLVEGGAHRRVVELHSARVHSADDMAAELGRVLGTTPAVVYPPRDQWLDILTGAGLSGEGAALMAELFDGINSGHVGYADDGERRIAPEGPADVFRRLVPGRAA